MDLRTLLKEHYTGAVQEQHYRMLHTWDCKHLPEHASELLDIHEQQRKANRTLLRTLNIGSLIGIGGYVVSSDPEWLNTTLLCEGVRVFTTSYNAYRRKLDRKRIEHHERFLRTIEPSLETKTEEA